MRCLVAIVVVLLNISTVFAQPRDELAGATARFQDLDRRLRDLPHAEHFAAHEKLAKQALALAKTSPESSEAESLLHWILSSLQTSPTAKQAVECLLKHHVHSEASLHRLPYYANHPTGWTSQLFTGFVNANQDDEHSWIVATYDALHEQSMLLMTDEIKLRDGDQAKFESRLGVDLVKELTEQDIARRESRVIDVFTKLAAQHGEHQIDGITVKELAEGAIFGVRHLRIGKTAGELSGKSSDNMQVSLNDHRGKVVMIDFWDTSCSPSLCAMPELKDAQEQLGRSKFILLGVSVDRDRTKLKGMMKNLEIDWPIILDSDSALQKRWQSMQLPSYFVLDAKHVVRYRGDDYRKAIQVVTSLVENTMDRD